MPTLFVNIKTVTGGFQISKPCIVLIYAKATDSPLVSKCLQNRKINLGRVIQREASTEEMEAESNRYRITFLMYHDWNKLINDEKKFTADPEWFKKLEDLKSKYPQFKDDGQSALPLDTEEADIYG